MWDFHRSYLFKHCSNMALYHGDPLYHKLWYINTIQMFTVFKVTRTKVPSDLKDPVMTGTQLNEISLSDCHIPRFLVLIIKIDLYQNHSIYSRNYWFWKITNNKSLGKKFLYFFYILTNNQGSKANYGVSCWSKPENNR